MFWGEFFIFEAQKKIEEVSHKAHLQSFLIFIQSYLITSKTEAVRCST